MPWRANWGGEDVTYHITVKPISIINNFIINSSLEGDVVLDLFMGSGSTGEAAIIHDRKFIGVEINNNYFETAKNRLTLLIWVNKGLMLWKKK